MRRLVRLPVAAGDRQVRHDKRLPEIWHLTYTGRMIHLQHRPLAQIEDPGARCAAEALRTWFETDLIDALAD